MEEEIGIEPNIRNPPYHFEPRLFCPYSWENTEEGEHNVPHRFHSLSEAVPSFRPNINLTPLPIVPVELSDDEVAFSDDSNIIHTIELTDLEITDLETLSLEDLHSKIHTSFVEHPEITAKYLENIITSQSSLKLVVFDWLEQFYAQNDGLDCAKLRNMLSKALISIRQTGIPDELSGDTRFESKEEAMLYLAQRLNYLTLKTSGLNHTMFYL